MGDNTILTPGLTGGQECAQPLLEQDTLYLIKDNYLGEFEDETLKSLARENLGVYPKTSVYTKQESDIQSKKYVKEALELHLSSDDPHGIIPLVESKLEGVVKQDGTTPFLNPQTGVDPVSDFHLVTKRFVLKLLNSHILAEDPHNIISKVNDILTNYAKLSQVYLKNLVYTVQEIDSKLSNFLKKDGTTPFIKPQIGIDPVSDSHLATKRYVDTVMWNHLSEIDPHGFLKTLNLRLAAYYKKSETYSKAETYSRILIDTIIRSLVNDAAAEAIEEHINQYDPHHTLEEVRKEGYVKLDGSVPFKAPQKGVEGVDPNDLVVLSLLQTLEEKLKEVEPIWKTSGPVLTTVGFVEDNSEVPETMTFLEIMDAIFYGKGIDVKSPPTAILGTTVKVDMYIHGSTGMVETVELFLNGVLIGIYTKDHFVNGLLSVDSNPITEDTTFTMRVTYTNGTVLEAECTTIAAISIFIGLLPEWYFGSNITYDYLMDLIKTDPVNNKTDGSGPNIETVSIKYNFTDVAEPKHPFVAIPKSYPDLYQMYTKSQQFGLDAFNIIEDTPLQVPGAEQDVIYTIYIYKEALIELHTEVTYQFNKE